ncbi:MAG: hypothetical protein PGN34_26470 [Methylobacterium frigidaeris]
MDINKFTILLEDTMKKAVAAAGGMDQFTACMSRPSGQLVELYGPMTDKILKQRARAKAQELYDAYNANPAFMNAIQQLGDKVERIPIETTNGAVSSMGALNHLKDTFGANLDKVLAGVKEPPSQLEGALLAVADMSITAALAFVPVAGPFLVPLSQGINGVLGAAMTGAMTGVAIGAGDNSLLFTTGNADMKSAQKTAINGNNTRQDRADAATGAGKTISDGLKNVTAVADKDGTFAQLAAQKGVASLIVTGIKIAIKKNDEKILKMADSADKSFAKLVGGTVFSQNQNVAQGVNTLGRLNIKMPDSLADDPKRINMYLSEKATLATFKTTTSRMFEEFFGLLLKIMNAGLEASFADATQGLNTPKLHGNNHKIALLILGYFYAKDWSGARAAARTAELNDLTAGRDRAQQSIDSNQVRLDAYLQRTDGKSWENYSAGDITKDIALFKKFDAIDAIRTDMRDNQGIVARNAEMMKILSTKTGLSTIQPKFEDGTSARAAFNVGRGASSKRNIVVDGFAGMGDLDKLPILVSKAENYFRALKSALTADIETAMVKGNNGFLKDEEFQKMWKLFIGSQLIVNHALNDSKIKIQSGGARKFFRALNPTTDATSIPDYYVNMIQDAGFIERYSSYTGTVSTQRKKDLALTGRMRWSRSPSNTERAMLITFCTVVVFTMDVGKISLGFYSWNETVEGLREVCKTISATAYQ